MATYAIGDLQGCHDEFMALLERIQFDREHDRLWLTGDLVNRGPQSLLALRAVRHLDAAVQVVLGNHDLHLLALANSINRKTRPDDTLDDILEAPDRDDLLEWLRQQPLLHDDPTLGYVMVHAGLAPAWDLAAAKACASDVSMALQANDHRFFDEMYGNEPSRWSASLTGTDRLRFAVNCLTRLRYVSADGSLLLKLKGPPATAPAGAIPWFLAPERRALDRKIIFGHWSALGYRATDEFISLDTGCVWGGQLTAVRLDLAGPPVQVDCQRREPPDPLGLLPD
jgi:bis(5'-nucleosyl)-tetraphosphatase (symmetrical)